MFSSIRAKLTLWYTLVLALVTITLTGLIYFSFVGVLRAESDQNLAEMANNFVVAANAEQADVGPNGQPADSVAEATSEFRFKDYQFVIISGSGNIVAKTSELELPDRDRTGRDPFTDYAASNEQYRVFNRPFVIGGQ